VIQSIYAMWLQLEDIAEEVQSSPASMPRRIEAVINSLNTVIKDIRSYIFDLRPSSSTIESLPAAIEGLATELRVNALIDTEITIDHALGGRLSDAQALGLYHIAQEALHNIDKHAEASSARVILTAETRSVRLEISDNGRGLKQDSVEEHAGQGIRNMKDRAKSLGASITIDSEPAVGTKIRVVMPLDGKTDRHNG
jgi:signal transduction histidine kinase